MTFTLQENEVKTVVENDNQKIERSQKREEAFLEKMLYGDYAAATKLLGDINDDGSNFNIYSVYQQYENATGRKIVDDVLKAYENGKIDMGFIEKLIPGTALNFMDGVSIPIAEYRKYVRATYENNIKQNDEITNFDVKTSQIAPLVPQNTKEQISSNQYVETSGENKFTVTRKENTIAVDKDGKTFTLKLDGVKEELQKMIYNLDANVIYRMASTDIKVNTYSTAGHTGTSELENVGAYYDVDDNSININEDIMSPEVMSRTITHEVGHSFYAMHSEPNEHFEQTFLEERAAWQKSDEPYKSGRHVYCTVHPYEMFAESYALLTTVNSESEYTIAKHFPKSFAIVKEMIAKKSK